MGYKLEKPYTDTERADFVCEHQGLNYYEDNNYLIMYLDNEKVINGEIIDISQTPEYIAEQEAKAKAIQDAKTITKRQLLFWLFQKKQIKESDILTAINQIPNENNRYLGQVSYDGTNNFIYGNPFISVIGNALGLTTKELIQCFDEAVLM